MNAKSLCGGEMMLHEIASILPRCELYAGSYQEPLPADAEIAIGPLMSGAAYLAQRYCLKLGGRPYYNEDLQCIGIKRFRLSDYCRYIRLRLSLMLNRKKIIAAIEYALEEDNLEYGMTGANRF